MFIEIGTVKVFYTRIVERFFCTSYLKVGYLALIPFAKPILITRNLSQSLKTPSTKSSEKLYAFVPFFALSLNSILQARRSMSPALLRRQNSIVVGPTATTSGVATMKKIEKSVGQIPPEMVRMDESTRRRMDDVVVSAVRRCQDPTVLAASVLPSAVAFSAAKTTVMVRAMTRLHQRRQEQQRGTL